MRLRTHKYLVAWAKASGLKVLGVDTEYFCLTGNPVAVVRIETRSGHVRSVCPADAYNLYWGPKAVTYGNPYHRTAYMKRREQERQEYLAKRGAK